MQLTRFTDLGLRTMMLLASGDSDGRRVTIRTVASAAGASEHHIAKAVARLVDLDMVAARRGRIGGLSLTEAGRTVSVGWLIRRLEGDQEVIQCEGVTPCPLLPGCRLRRALSDAKEAFYRELDRHTVDDLVRDARLPIVSLHLATTETTTEGIPR
ncbi:Rrf2 family transcriptional regulator [Mycobacterium hodleri]|uniref:RrF2 family transcriptional regulator n=1 Tax=Mycolicibacterium hodleri TaxID=49897 RepID=UPI0021F28B58|nr:Rrf2 family transcriptional regulator [Mycolicibacterium hodleri]MCV7136653.1 Rrf2 family transcriptional regulator [Mycolicibacterium hodleri]